jgi:hypothetical protein
MVFDNLTAGGGSGMSKLVKLGKSSLNGRRRRRRRLAAIRLFFQRVSRLESQTLTIRVD